MWLRGLRSREGAIVRSRAFGPSRRERLLEPLRLGTLAGTLAGTLGPQVQCGPSGNLQYFCEQG